MHISPFGGLNPFQRGQFGGHHGGHQVGQGTHRGGHGGAAETTVSKTKQTLALRESEGSSARNLIAKQSSTSIEKSGFEDRRDFVKSAKKLVRGALKSLARDVGRAFESFGLDAKAGKALVKGFIKPLVQAIRDGVDFTAQLKMAAVQKTTLTTADGISEQLSIVAKSVDIAVNHDTGEVSVNVQKIAIEQESHVAFERPPPAPLGPPEPAPEAGAAPSLPGIGEILERVLSAAKARDDDEGDDDGDDDDDGRIARLADQAVPQLPVAPSEASEPVTFDPAIEVLLPNADAADEAAAARIEALRSRIQIKAAQRFHNEAGELISRLRVDARISLTRVLEAEPKALAELAATPFQPRGGLDIRA